jgi:hypothetical protein
VIIDPVFVDRSGRRRRLVLIAAIAGTSVLLAILAAMVVGFTSSGPAAVPGWPGLDGHHVATKPQPAATSSTTTSTSKPRPAATATTAARQVVTASASAPTPTRRASTSASPSARALTGPKGRGHSPTTRPSRKN